MVSLRKPKGMNDVLPDDVAAWHRVEATYAKTMQLHGFREIRTPHLESTSLFVRTVGEGTDIVSKEMFSFVHHDDPLTLRPEGTAGVARAFVEHGLHAKEPVTRLYYLGPMFRAERPQRGRYRQFFQAGAEIFGDPGPACDAEMIDMLVGFLHKLGIKDARVYVGSIGTEGTRARYKEKLLAYLEPRKGELSEDSQRRLETNPLRILDSKNPKDREVTADAPAVLDVLEDSTACAACSRAGRPSTASAPTTTRARRVLEDSDRAHFERDAQDRVDKKLVRGLAGEARPLVGDTLVGGGRYDGMIADLGGQPTPAIGFAAGIERLIIASDSSAPGPVVDAFVAPLGDRATPEGLKLARELRRCGVACEVDARGSSLKAVLRRANSLGARVVLIVGDGELDKNVVTVKDMAAHAQEEIAREVVVGVVHDRLAAAGGVREESA